MRTFCAVLLALSFLITTDVAAQSKKKQTCTYAACMEGKTQACSRAGSNQQKRITCCSRDCPK